ncbi:MAG: hypothetical protein ACFFCM_12925 [Promethearchaeota archaeon]
MEVMEVKVNLINNSKKMTDDDFWSEFAKAYFEHEKMEKISVLKEYQKAYKEIEDKDSFNAQYLEVLIDQLKSEV